MKNLNLVELLRDCPNGMELDCTMFDNVTFVRVNYKRKQFPIEIAVSGLRSKYLTKEGCFHDTTLLPEAKCVIFPKGKTTWEGFVPPVEFKDGDVLYVDCTNENDCKQYDYIFILDKIYNGKVHSYCYYYIPDDDFRPNRPVGTYLTSDKYPIRLATEEEKQKLFDAIKANGYHWNAETKTLEKLIKTEFKIGDRIRHKTNTRQKNVVTEIKDTHYILDDESALPFTCQDQYELAQNKFDITTLKEFDSKVLVRDYDSKIWIPTFWGKYLKEDSNCRYLTTNGCYKYCIPYDSNKELLGTTHDCDDFYKTW